ncbi:hypothetical protein HYDPIDRAFT_171077 [Hydnomerulius pinastri MD-312]|uniref:Uncharacterized protein n=1 Tax=Hydnomerulius pinastri MD-312 TaxID=994086 RepID=A0A0C9W891_9AGAM|nr:hypothetical protein HYDPIDRAFT_171077 [Hydnomerulius pinastri MD-312]
MSPLAGLFSGNGTVPGNTEAALEETVSTKSSDTSAPPCSMTTSTTSSTTDLMAQMANASITDPSTIVVPATEKAKVIFMKNLSKLLHDGPGINASAEEVTNTKEEGDNAPTSSTPMRLTHLYRSICHMDWAKANPNGSMKLHDAYWKKFSQEQKDIMGKPALQALPESKYPFIATLFQSQWSSSSPFAVTPFLAFGRSTLVFSHGTQWAC